MILKVTLDQVLQVSPSRYHAGELVHLHFPDIYSLGLQASKRDEERSVIDRKPIPSE